MIIAQITDTHIARTGGLVCGAVDSAAALARCVASIMRLEPLPHVVLASGDLVNDGEPEQYRLLRKLLAPLTMPVYLIPGNHDDRDALRAAFPDHRYLQQCGEHVQFVVEGCPVRLVALDTVIPGVEGGTLCARRLAWLEARLAEAPQKPTLIFTHHPPFATGIRSMDEIALEPASAAALGAIVGHYPQIERIVCGHIHRGIQARWHGTTVSVCPSAAFQYTLNLRADGLDVAPGEPPAYQLHFWNGTELVTHTITVTGNA